MARLAEERRLLVTGDGEDWHFTAQYIRRENAEVAKARSHLWQDGARNVLGRAQGVVPTVVVDVVAERAGGVGSVGDVRWVSRQFCE